ncbi:MAG: hypothetical protein MUC58_05660 [Rhizobiaceae bacterium]|jgi:hypothetical protein|nr:hypothetical protein [Rhizobiaceae bacterium]
MRGAALLGLTACGALLAACQPEVKTTQTVASPQRAALPVMERVALGARECWFRSKDKDFSRYRLSPELTSMTGKPRILIVPARNPNGLPLAVVEAQGNPARMQAFGPLMGEPLGDRIRADVNRWANGDDTCSTTG